MALRQSLLFQSELVNTPQACEKWGSDSGLPTPPNHPHNSTDGLQLKVAMLSPEAPEAVGATAQKQELS